MIIKNLTPHPVVVCQLSEDGELGGFTGVGPRATPVRYRVVTTLPPAGQVARAAQRDEVVGELEMMGASVPIIRSRFGATTDLPPPEGGTLLVVSIVTAQAAQAEGRSVEDLLSTTDPVRDAAGKILGCLKFAKV